MAFAPPISCPRDVEKALSHHDWRLRVAWDPRAGNFEIVRLGRGWWKHPETVFDPISGRIRTCYLRCFKVLNEHGNPRSPDFSDVETLKAADLDAQGLSPGEYVDRLEAKEARADLDVDAKAEPFYEEAGRLGDAVAAGRVSRGWTPDGARYW